jgi:predicted nuclease of predicted toxin-antitoxin system
MKFLVDECAGVSIARWLQEQGYDVIFVGDLLAGIDDYQVLQKAYAEHRILITNDKDFGELIFKNNQQHVGVILLRLDHLKVAEKILILNDLISKNSNDLQFNFVVVTDNGVRIIKSTLSVN